MATISIKHIFWLLVKADHARYGGACQLPLRFAYSAGICALPQMPRHGQDAHATWHGHLARILPVGLQSAFQ